MDPVKSLGGRVKSIYRFQPAIAAEMSEKVVDALGRNLLYSMLSVAFGDPGIEINLVYFLSARQGKGAPSAGATFTFVVDNVILSGWTYDAANSETIE